MYSAASLSPLQNERWFKNANDFVDVDHDQIIKTRMEIWITHGK